MQRRVRDDGRSLAAFIDQVDVICPRCAGRALVTMKPAVSPEVASGMPARLTCRHCGMSRTQRLATGAVYSYRLGSDGRDPFFGLPLWLTATSAHGMVFAFNERHLAALEAFAGAELRERHGLAATMLRNRTLHSRLPRWMKLGRNRADVLHALARLRRKSGDGAA